MRRASTQVPRTGGRRLAALSLLLCGPLLASPGGAAESDPRDEVAELLSLARDAMADDRPKRAEDRLRAAFERAGALLPGSPERDRATIWLAEHLLSHRGASGAAEAARVYAAESERLDAQLPADSELRFPPLASRVALLARSGACRDALAPAREAARLAEIHARDAAGRRRLADVLVDLATCREEVGDGVAAEEARNETRAMYRRAIGLRAWEAAPDLVEPARRLARLEIAAGDLDAAEDAWRLACTSLEAGEGWSGETAETLAREIRDLASAAERFRFLDWFDGYVEAAANRAEGEPSGWTPPWSGIVRRTGAGPGSEGEAGSGTVSGPVVPHAYPDAVALPGRPKFGDPDDHIHESDTPGLVPAEEKRVKGAIFPEGARQQAQPGVVQLRFVVRADGSVDWIEVLRAHPTGMGFEESAIDAARGSRWEPARLDGDPVDSWAVRFVRFDLR